VHRVREATLGAFTHQDLPFERLVDELHVERSLVHSPLFQVMFAEWRLENAAGEALDFPGVRATPLAVEGTGAHFDLGLTVVAGDDAIDGSLDYRTELFDAATVERMAEHLCALLDAVAADPERRPCDVELIGPAERARVAEWNATDRAYPHGATLHGLFEARAAATPDAVAVVSDAGTLTYAELDARAARLAHALRGRGVGPEARVAVCVDADRAADREHAVYVLDAGMRRQPVGVPGELYVGGDGVARATWGGRG
jgi:non-ribosomal peptide synthetase component F